MPLAQYQDLFWYPSGAVSANVEARVFLEGSNTFATLYTDGTGSTLLPNPTSTDAGGVLTFWAEEGEYWIRINDESFRVSVGAPNMDVFEAVSKSVSTGILSGGNMSVNGVNAAAIDITPLVAYVMDFVTDPEIPGYKRFSLPAMTVPLAGASLTRIVTWWLVDSTGAVVQQAAKPSNTQRRTHAILGATAYDQTSGTIINVQPIPTIVPEIGNQLIDLMEAMGPFNISGNVITPNGANLSINRSAGTVFDRGFNHFIGGVVTNDPHVISTSAQTPVSLDRITQLVSGVPAPPVTTIDPTKWDNGGVLTPVAGNDATLQRVWLVPAGPIGDQVFVQYGQQVFADLNAAVDAFGSGTYVVNPAIDGIAILIATIAVVGNATALNNSAQCIIKRAGKLAFP